MWGVVHVKEHFCVVQSFLVLPHFIPRTPVFRIQSLLFFENRRIFLGKFFHSWQLCHPTLPEGILCRFVKCNLFPVCFKERFAIARLSVLDINIAGFGIIDNMLFQGGDFNQPLFSIFQIFVNAVKLAEVELAFSRSSSIELIFCSLRNILVFAICFRL